ncbi:MAG: NCS2 family permease [Fimbriimonadaceae bacterium]|nr:NCS2 family permease [Fimbriimonadaceae bacterium]
MFGVARAGSTPGREVVAGVTTFLTMAYIVAVNPAILENAGIPIGPSFTATALVAIIGTTLMALIANRPFAIAPYMGENAFIAFTVVKGMGFPWATALAATFVAGLLFVVLTLTHVRAALANSIPTSLKSAFAVGIGLFLSLLGFAQMGIVQPGAGGALLRLGDLTQPPAVVGLLTFLVMIVLSLRKATGAILIAILVGTCAAFAFGVAKTPTSLVSAPPSLAPVFMKLDFTGVSTVAFLQVTLVVFVMAFLDTMGTLLGLAHRANMLDADGNLPDIERPLLADAVSTTVAPLLGTTVSGAYIESAAGIEAGGRTGLTALVVAGLFGLTLFLSPVFTAIPGCAYGPALVLVGVLMLGAAKNLAFDRPEELIPAFAVVSLIAFTFNIGIGMAAGFLLYPVTMAAAGRARAITGGAWAMFALSAVFFAFSLRGH